VVVYLDRMRELGFPEGVVRIERDSWILVAAQRPDQVARLLAHKRGQIEHETLRRLYLDVGDLVDCTPDDPRLPALADRVVAFLDAAIAAVGDAAQVGDVEVGNPAQVPEEQVSEDLVALLDAAFVDAFPCAPMLLRLLEERGYTGWTDIRRARPPGGDSAR